MVSVVEYSTETIFISSKKSGEADSCNKEGASLWNIMKDWEGNWYTKVPS